MFVIVSIQGERNIQIQDIVSSNVSDFTQYFQHFKEQEHDEYEIIGDEMYKNIVKKGWVYNTRQSEFVVKIQCLDISRPTNIEKLKETILDDMNERELMKLDKESLVKIIKRARDYATNLSYSDITRKNCINSILPKIPKKVTKWDGLYYTGLAPVNCFVNSVV
jgi:hypothetical protein